jgi:DNA-directed RNA polymerase subunit L
MKLTILEKSANEIKIEIDQTDMTLLHPLVEELLRDKAVAEAQYMMGHPVLDKPVLRVKTKTGKPETAIKRCSKKLGSTFGKMRESFENQL